MTFVILSNSFIRHLKDFIEVDDEFYNLRLSTSQFKIYLIKLTAPYCDLSQMLHFWDVPNMFFLDGE